MNGVMQNIQTFASGTWELILVVICLAIAWYILSMALEAYKVGNIKKVFEGMTGWIMVIIFGMCIAIPMTLYMVGSVFDQISDSKLVTTVETTVSEGARFAADMADGDGQATLPNIPSPGVGEPSAIRVAPQPPALMLPTPVPHHHAPQTQPHHPSAAPTLVPWTPPTPISQQPQHPVTPSQVVVARGDTLYKIASRIYGNGEWWKQLCAHNFANVQHRCDNLVVGQVILIPPAQ